MAAATSRTAETEENHTATIRVVQIEPGPIPTLYRLLHFQLKFSGLRVDITDDNIYLWKLLNLFNTLTTPCVCP
jgi:hypothetical protein